MSKKILGSILVAVCVGSSPAAGEYPGQLYHQGVIAVHGEHFTGEGDFRFALVDRDTDAYLWVNDGSGVATAEPPTNPVTLTVVNGIYNVRLGDTDLANMTAIPRAVFNEDNVVLRIWFDDVVNGVYQLSPDQVLTSVPYAQRLPNVFVDEDTGNVGIGTTAPDNALSVDGDADVSGSLGIGTTTPANKLSVSGNADFSGNVGLGTSSPLNKLDVGGSAVVGSAYAGSEPAPPNGLLVQGNVGIGTESPQNELDVEGSAVVGSSYSGSTTAPADSLLVEGSIGIGTSSPKNKLDVEGGAVVGYSYSGTETAPSNGLLVQGNVGIGTAAPAAPLHVTGAAGAAIRAGGDGDGDKAHLQLFETTTSGSETGIELEYDGDNAANELSFFEWELGEKGAALLTLERTSGNVGIGTDTPAGQLALGPYQGGTGANEIENYDKQLVLGGDFNISPNAGEAVKLLISEYDNDSPSDIYPIYAVDENNAVDFYVRNKAGSRTAYFGGNVGIGTTAPKAKLDVDGGTVRITKSTRIRCDAGYGTSIDYLGEREAANYTVVVVDEANTNSMVHYQVMATCCKSNGDAWFDRAEGPQYTGNIRANFWGSGRWVMVEPVGCSGSGTEYARVYFSKIKTYP